jgi:hypothetical protein
VNLRANMLAGLQLETLPVLLEIGPSFSILEVQGNFRDLEQVQVLPHNAVAFTVLDSQVPVRGFFSTVKLDLERFSVSHGVFPEDVFSPFVGAVRRDVKLMNLHARPVVEGKVLISRKCRRSGEQQHAHQGKQEKRFLFDGCSFVLQQFGFRSVKAYRRRTDSTTIKFISAAMGKFYTSSVSIYQPAEPALCAATFTRSTRLLKADAGKTGCPVTGSTFYLPSPGSGLPTPDSRLPTPDSRLPAPKREIKGGA